MNPLHAVSNILRSALSMGAALFSFSCQNPMGRTAIGALCLSLLFVQLLNLCSHNKAEMHRKRSCAQLETVGPCSWPLSGSFPKPPLPSLFLSFSLLLSFSISTSTFHCRRSRVGDQKPARVSGWPIAGLTSGELQVASGGPLCKRSCGQDNAETMANKSTPAQLGTLVANCWPPLLLLLLLFLLHCLGYTSSASTTTREAQLEGPPD